MSYILPFMIAAIIFMGMKNKLPVYSVFCDGVLWGLKTVMGIFPVILSVTVGISMLKASGGMDFLCRLLQPIAKLIHLPQEVLPLVLIRPFSGGGALGVLTDILNRYGADSFVGVCACVIMGSCETTFYTLAVYFKNTRVKYTRHIIPAAVIGDMVGVGAGIAVSMALF